MGPPNDNLEQARPTSTSTGHWKKGKGTRAWMLLNTMGHDQVLEVGKHAIMRRTGLPARDLRMLDPLLANPSTILGRERAIVINLERIKAIITAQEVLLLNSRDPSVSPFVEELKSRLERNDDDSNWNNLIESEKVQSRAGSPRTLSEGFSKFKDQDIENRDGSKVLPFEFVVLEACIQAVCSSLETEAKTLELEAHPVLDNLTSKITTLNLDRVRQIKSRLVAITGRVHKVRDELEHLLDDDVDMAEMYLTEKFEEKHLETNSSSSMNEGNDTDDEDPQPDIDEGNMPPEISLESCGCSTSNPHINQVLEVSNAVGKDSHGNHTSDAHSHSAMDKKLDVEELEMLLEAYFVQVDGTLNNLSTLKEYVDDTEDFVNILLDDKQNHLLRMGVMLTTATLMLSFFIVVAGILGMNINIDLFNDEVNGEARFLWTAGGGTALCIFLYLCALAWYKQKRLLE